MSYVDAVKGLMEDETKTDTRSQHKKAFDDLQYLCMQLGGYSLFPNVQYTSLTYETERLCDLLVLGHDAAQKKVVFPAEHIRLEPVVGKLPMHVAVVCYAEGKASGAYMFSGECFKKAGLFSMFGYDKKKGTASIDLGNKAKLDQYSFGNAIKVFGKGG